MKQSTEEGIARQGNINERNVEAEASMQLGIRRSSRLDPSECDEEQKHPETEMEVMPNISEVEEQINLQERSAAVPIQEGFENSNQKLPRCIQKLLIGILNVNTLTAYKLEEIMKMYIIQDFDIIALVDTRITKIEENAYNAIIRKCQRRGDYHKYFDLKEHNEGPGAKKVGGMLFLMSSRCGAMVSTFELGDGLGVYSEVTHKVGSIILTTSATYWPSKRTGRSGEGSLDMQVRKYMDKFKLNYNEPLDYIRMECASRIEKANRLGHAYLIMGDMNQPWESRDGNEECIKDWAIQNNMTSSRQSSNTYLHRNTRDANMHKRTGGSELDHILTNEISMYMQYREGFDDAHAHDNLSDHMMQIIMLNIPMMPRIKRAKEKKKQNEIIDM